ncbi:UNVERIFIED_CONTAM: hypothetical protein RMT77_010705 [Armadillidium vulgare]
MNNFILFGFLMSLTFIQSAVGNSPLCPSGTGLPGTPVNLGLIPGLVKFLCDLLGRQGGSPVNGIALDCPKIRQIIRGSVPGANPDPLSPSLFDLLAIVICLIFELPVGTFP